MNQSDACICNELVNGKQFTIVFDIDDLLLSNNNPNIVTLYIRKLKQEYVSREDLTVTKGKIHEYLGMTLDFRAKLEVRFSQYDFYVSKVTIYSGARISFQDNTRFLFVGSHEKGRVSHTYR